MRNFTKLFFLIIFIPVQSNASMTAAEFISECLGGEEEIIETSGLPYNLETRLVLMADVMVVGVSKGYCAGMMQSSVEAARLSTEMFNSSENLFDTCREITPAGLVAQTKSYISEHGSKTYTSATKLLLSVIKDNYNTGSLNNACEY